MSFVPPIAETTRPPLRHKHARRRGWATYLRVTWLEYVCLVVVGGLTLGVYCTPMFRKDHRVVSLMPSINLSNKDQPFQEFQVPMDISHPWVKEPIPTFGCALVVVFVPLLMIGIFQLKTRSLWDLHAGVMGVLKALVSTSFICTIQKHFIGGFRPYYLEACQPDWNAIVAGLHQKIYRFNATLCKGNPRDVDRALQTFPSGHASSCFAAAIFLALYLNAKLKVFSDHASHFWAFMVVLTPLVSASLISGSMNTSHQHQAYDLVFGIVIGLVIGMLAYRSAYAAVFDFRYNHIPLPPFAIKTQYSRFGTGCRHKNLESEEYQSAEDDELVFWTWWKHSGSNIEGKEKEMAWLRSIRSVRVTGRELGLKIKPRMRKCSQDAMVLEHKEMNSKENRKHIGREVHDNRS